MKCLRIYTTPDGESHFDEVELPTTKRSVHPDAVPFEVSASYQASCVRLTRIPTGMLSAPLPRICFPPNPDGAYLKVFAMRVEVRFDQIAVGPRRRLLWRDRMERRISITGAMSLLGYLFLVAGIGGLVAYYVTIALFSFPRNLEIILGDAALVAVGLLGTMAASSLRELESRVRRMEHRRDSER